MTRRTHAERVAALDKLERLGIVSHVTLWSPGDGSRRFELVAEGIGTRVFRSAELDLWIDGALSGWAAPRRPRKVPVAGG